MQGAGVGAHEIRGAGGAAAGGIAGGQAMEAIAARVFVVGQVFRGDGRKRVKVKVWGLGANDVVKCEEENDEKKKQHKN